MIAGIVFSLFLAWIIQYVIRYIIARYVIER
jgi:hypothetical protein